MKSKIILNEYNQKDLLENQELRLINYAKEGWNRSLKEYYYPPLNQPDFIFDYTHKEGFYIDPEHKWQITMNLANTPVFRAESEYVDFYYIISLHEISHYQIIPYDGLINARLLKSAMKHVNQIFAPIIVNIFADLVIDKRLYLEHPNLVKWELKTIYNYITNKMSLSHFSNILFHLYEKVLNIKITEQSINQTDDSLVVQISKIILKDFFDESKWEQKVRKIAFIMKKLVKDTFKINKISTKNGGLVKEIEIEIPQDIFEIMDNPLKNRNIDKLKSNNKENLKRKAEEFAKETHYSEFGAPAFQAGLLIDKNPLAIWYRGKAKNLLDIKIFEKKTNGQVPIYPEVWRIGDSIDDLDIIQTLLVSPVIIPNITTRKWIQNVGENTSNEEEIPDLLIVLDSSGSMKWRFNSKIENKKGTYHTALLASFASLHYAVKKGVKFSIINFSNMADICEWTMNYQKAEETLLRYQGGGTILPTKAIVEQCNKAEKKSLIFIITDFGIYNWSKSKKILMELTLKGHKIVGFFIGSSEIPKDKFKDLLPHVSFYPIENVKDLIDIVIKEIKINY
ncbi:MAG: VWA domain-containing protein [Candidatus Lokiarchaeota archaeon]|nr:VWA domain-containing protein [Candidatus Lokiarchaeota archaeon]